MSSPLALFRGSRSREPGAGEKRYRLPNHDKVEELSANGEIFIKMIVFYCKISFQVIDMKRLIFASICWRVKSFYRLSTKLKEKYDIYNVNNLKSNVQFTFK